MYLPLPVIFISLYGFELYSSILSFQLEGLLLVPLAGQVLWQQTPSALVYLVVP